MIPVQISISRDLFNIYYDMHNNYKLQAEDNRLKNE